MSHLWPWLSTNSFTTSGHLLGYLPWQTAYFLFWVIYLFTHSTHPQVFLEITECRKLCQALKDKQTNRPFPLVLSYVEPQSLLVLLPILGMNFIFRTIQNLVFKAQHFNILRQPTCHFRWGWVLPPLLFYFFLSFLEKWEWENFLLWSHLWFWRMREAIGKTMGKGDKTGCLRWL